MNLTLFLFRRDLRLEDNTALLFALKNSKKVIAAFIFTPEQVENNPYKSSRSLQFMIESLEDLTKEIESKGGKLYLFFGKPEEVVSQCIQDLNVNSIMVNCDYTPYSIQRDQKIASLCKKRNISFHSFHDALLHPPEETVKSDGTPYTVFTPFYRNAVRIKIALPLKNPHTNYYSEPISFSIDHSFYKKILPQRFNQQKGGRTEGLKILKNLSAFSNYEHFRDFPAEDKTTHFSPHLKFTTCSPREIYYSMQKELGADCALIRSLYWRDFFSSISFYFPNVFKGAFKSQFNNINWSRDTKQFLLWCEGKTGFPIVDAGMRELNQTGFMHNRVRMIAASFLVKDLHIDWRWGEKYFAQTLIDYDPAINNGNWQWVASTGCDAQPYFRIFNPWNQQMKFDPDCLYIKHWVPELASISPKTIHSWHLQKDPCLFSYPSPIVDHAKESKICLEEYKK
jgi:deoxyribodipyrimidine photo-lyase